MNHEQGIRNKDRLVLALGSLLLNPKRMKHIESIQPELAAGEISRLLVGDDDATATAALTRLLHDVTGCDIPQTSDLPESEVEELVPLCVSILRRHWQTPLTCLGDGITPMSLSDLLRQTIGDRVQGNEALGIPPANANIPTAVSALLARKIGGVPQAPDGISLAQLLCTPLADTITELKDDNVGWEMNKAFPIATFANATKLTFGCGSITAYQFQTTRELEIHYPHCKEIADINFMEKSENVSVWFESMEILNQRTGNGGITTFWVKAVYLPAVKKGVWRVGDNASHANSTTKYIYIGCKGDKSELVMVHHNYLVNTSITDIEFGEGACQNITISNCNGLAPENMYNHILCRLKQDEPMCGEGVTITLGTTNLDKLEAVEEYNLKLTELTDTYGYTFA